MVENFYDELTPYYHLILNNWKSSVARQAVVLNKIINEEWGENVKSVLDVSCGIGTQSIGLAEIGYKVTASDFSTQAIERAKNESVKKGLNIDYSVADMRNAFRHHKREFDLLISCDNSVPHLLSDDAISTAFKEFYRCVRPDGGCLITIRDYDQEECQGTQIKPYGIREENDAKYLIFQVWEFEGKIYNLSMYIIKDDGDEQGMTRIFRTKYYAVSPNKIIELMKSVGFKDVQRIDNEYYQPVIVGTR